MKKEKVDQNPEDFKVVKPEKEKSKMPKFFKIIIVAIVILLVSFISWELYQVYNMSNDIEDSSYDDSNAVADLLMGSIVIQKFDLENFDVSQLSNKSNDDLQYAICRSKKEYQKIMSNKQGIKEFTDEDFKKFYVLVIYKENMNLTMDSRHSGFDYDNIVFTESNDVNQSVLIVALPDVNQKNVNLVIKKTDKIIITSPQDVTEKINNSWSVLTEYLSRKYFNNQSLTNATMLIKDVKLVNEKPNQFFITKGDLQEPTGEVSTYWQANVYLEQNKKYVLHVLIDCESGELVAGYDLSKQ